MSEQTLQERAKIAAACFIQLHRPDRELFTSLKDDSPEWVKELVHTAHGEMLPDDIRYAFIREAVDAIAEGDEDAEEFADNVTPYTSERVAWLGSHGLRQAYVDEAVSEGLGGNKAGVVETIALGIYQERAEVFSLVYEALSEGAA